MREKKRIPALITAPFLFSSIVLKMQDKVVTEGENTSVTFSCGFDANPFTEKTVKWSLPDRPGGEGEWVKRAEIDVDILAKVSTMTLHFPNKGDGGRVKCEADNGVEDVRGRIADAVADLTVYREWRHARRGKH